MYKFRYNIYKHSFCLSYVRNIIFRWFLTAFFPPYLTHRNAESLRPYWCLYFLFCLTEDKLVIKGEWTIQLFLFFWEHSFSFLRLHFTGATRSREWSISRHISKPGWHSHQEFPALQGTQGGGIHLWAQFSSVIQSCPTLCDPMNCSTPGLPVHHHLPEFTQPHVHQVGDAIQPSHPLSSPSPPAPNPSQHQSLFQWVNSSHVVAKVLEFQL